MTLVLTPEILRAAYDYLKVTQPFDKWNLPDGEDIRFRVTRTGIERGLVYYQAGDETIINISSACNGHTNSLMATMAHEMAHLIEMIHAMDDPKSEHGKAYKKLSNEICKIHGFDPKLF
jgi:predicted SprT family Zn-dependent metalloprotease